MSPKVIKAISTLMGPTMNIEALAENMVNLGIGSFAECYEMGIEALGELESACEDAGGDCMFCCRESSCQFSER